MVDDALEGREVRRVDRQAVERGGRGGKDGFDESRRLGLVEGEEVREAKGNVDCGEGIRIGDLGDRKSVV